MAIEHLMDRTIHRTELENSHNVLVEVRADGRVFVSCPGLPATQVPIGCSLTVGIKVASPSTFRYSATKFGRTPAEVTSVKRVPRRPAHQRNTDYVEDGWPPDDTPRLDTSFHDHEMDV